MKIRWKRLRSRRWQHRFEKVLLVLMLVILTQLAWNHGARKVLTRMFAALDAKAGFTAPICLLHD